MLPAEDQRRHTGQSAGEGEPPRHRAVEHVRDQRDDVSSNEVFTSFLEENPALTQYAEAIPYAVPPIVNENFSDIQTALSDEGLIPAVTGDKTPEQAWEDAKAAMQALLE